jgi:hypothetical protein
MTVKGYMGLGPTVIEKVGLVCKLHGRLFLVFSGRCNSEYVLIEEFLFLA